MRRILFALLCCALCLTATATLAQQRQRGAQTKSAQTKAAQTKSGETKSAEPAASAGTEIMVPMRDGVKLGTSVYLPPGNGPWPVVLSRTPYGKNGRRSSSNKYTNAGYVYVIQDCRGRFTSEGSYEPYQPDIEDGYDAVEWAAKQPWCNGKVGITGRSALGINANLCAASDPPHLVCAYVVTASETLFDESYFMGGVFREHFRGNFMRLQGVEDQIPMMKARAVMDEQWRRTDMIHHRAKVNVPMFQVGGWFDMFAKGAVGNYEYLQNYGREGAKGKQKLWMGPWGHSAIDGELVFPGERGLGRAFDDEMRWFEFWLKGVDNGIMKEPPVTYFHMASARKDAVSPKNKLVQTASWPPASRDTRYYLQPGFGVSPVRPLMDRASTSYKDDPASPVPTFGGANYNNNRERPITVGPVDQRPIGKRDDYLRFNTPVLTEDLTVQGRIDMELWASTDAPDTDFMVKLVDVYPDGYEAIVLDSPIRARYRNGREPGDIEMMHPGRPTMFLIDLWSTSITFEKGHRLAIHVASTNAPRFEINPNTGEAAGQSTIPPRVATNTIYHDQTHPSAIVLPVTDGLK